MHKAHYLLLNVECDKPALDELVGAFRFSDAVLRHLVVRRDEAVTEPSLMAQAHEEEKAREAQAAARDSRPRERPRDDSESRSDESRSDGGSGESDASSDEAEDESSAEDSDDADSE